MNPMRRSPSPPLDISAESSYMSGVQGGGCHFDNALSFLMTFERSTTCRYPHVVAYVVGYVEGLAVVGYVEGLVVYSALAEASTRPRRGFWHSERNSVHPMRVSAALLQFAAVA
jgi:hypothetical protein